MSNLNLDSLNNQEPSTPPIVAKRTTINTSSRRGSSISSRMSSVSSSKFNFEFARCFLFKFD